MLHIALICSGGISATILMKKICQEADNLNINITIKAYGIQDLYSMERMDYILLSPQASYIVKLAQTKVSRKEQVLCIHSFDYSSLNGKGILQELLQVEKVLGNHHEIKHF